MKKFLFFLALAAGILTVSCNKERFPYEKAPEVTGAQVFFPEGIQQSYDLSADASSFVIPLYRGSKDLAALNVPLKASGDGIDDGIFTVPTTVSFPANVSKIDIPVSVDMEKLGTNNYIPLTVEIADNTLTTIYGIKSVTIKAGVSLPWVLFDAGILVECPLWWGEEEEKEMYYQQISEKMRFCKIEGCFGKETIAGGGTYDVQDYTWYWNTETNEVYIPYQYMGYVTSGYPVYICDETSFYNFYWYYNKGAGYGGSTLDEGSEEWFAFCDKFRQAYPRSGGDYYPYYDGKGTFYLADGYSVGHPNKDFQGFLANGDLQPGYGNCDTFTGASFPDYTVDIEYLGLFIDKAGSTFACADLDFVGKDAQSCKAALAYTADPAEVLALIEANDESVIALKEAGEFRLQMPEEAESGKYTIAVASYDDKGEVAYTTFVTFKYTVSSGDGPKPVPVDDKFTTDDIVGAIDMESFLATEWDIYAIPQDQDGKWLDGRYYIGGFKFQPDEEENFVSVAGLGGGDYYGYDDALHFELYSGVLYSQYTGLGQFNFNQTTIYVNDEYLTSDGGYYPASNALVGFKVDDGLIAFAGYPDYKQEYGLDFIGVSFELYDTEDREYTEYEDESTNYWGSLAAYSYFLFADPNIYEHPEEGGSSVTSLRKVEKQLLPQKSFKAYAGPLSLQRPQLKVNAKADVIASGRIPSLLRPGFDPSFK